MGNYEKEKIIIKIVSGGVVDSHLRFRECALIYYHAIFSQWDCE